LIIDLARATDESLLVLIVAHSSSDK
jgi:hypothetical protein